MPLSAKVLRPGVDTNSPSWGLEALANQLCGGDGYTKLITQLEHVEGMLGEGPIDNPDLKQLFDAIERNAAGIDDPAVLDRLQRLRDHFT